MNAKVSRPATVGGQPAGATWLFVPGDRWERFDKAVAAGPDHVVLDLEDAVPGPRKSAARSNVLQWLSAGGAAWVRVNGVGTSEHAADLDALLTARPEGLRGLMLPKATLAALGALRAYYGGDFPPVPLVALIEDAAGIRDAFTIADDPAVVAVAFGAIDYALDIEAEESFEPLLYARSALVAAARAAGLPGPIDGVSVDVGDPAAAGHQARRSRALGFAGKLCIHPSQIESVALAFAPSPEDVAWARELESAMREIGVDLSTCDPAMAVTVDGQMVDRPVILRARRALARSRY